MRASPFSTVATLIVLIIVAIVFIVVGGASSSGGDAVDGDVLMAWSQAGAAAGGLNRAERARRMSG